MAGRRSERLSHKQIFTYLMMGAVVCMLLPVRVTNHLDHVLSVLVAPFSKGSQDMSLMVTDKIHQDDSGEVPSDTPEEPVDATIQDTNRLVNIEQELKYYKDLTDRLSGLRQNQSLDRARLIVAYITGSDSSNQREVKFLDRGTRNQVESGQIVIGWPKQIYKDNILNDEETDAIYEQALSGAVVGRISDAGSWTSSLQLISDPGMAMKVAIEPAPQRREDWRVKGILKGKGLGQISVHLIPATVPVKTGDVVLARSDDEGLPMDMIIGYISSCRRTEKNPVEWQILVQPAVDLQNLREVVVIKR
ncbi:MAG: hypothetical protein JW860_05875 [Sedimentisphaerales bacterium]|nr:hypothetical protein [Sedimentisphaerales bacterium]